MANFYLDFRFSLAHNEQRSENESEGRRQRHQLQGIGGLNQMHAWG